VTQALADMNAFIEA